MQKRTNYPYAVARVQAKRSKLFERSHFEKMLQMDVSEITRTIEESAYKNEVDELGNRFQGLDLLEAAITVNEERTYQSVRSTLAGPGREILEAFLLRNLVENVKTILRGKFGGVSSEEMLKELLLEDLDTYHLFTPLLEANVQGVQGVVQQLLNKPGPMAPFIGALGKVPEEANLSAYEDALDKAYISWLLESSEKFHQKGANLIREFVVREIDARNLRNAARWVLVGEGNDFTPFIVPGGKRLKIQTVTELASAKDLQEFRAVFEGTTMANGELLDALDQSIAQNRVAPFMGALERSLYGDLEKLSHQNPLTILPILNYVVRKQLEVRRLRAIARGRAAGLGANQLKELLP